MHRNWSARRQASRPWLRRSDRRRGREQGDDGESRGEGSLQVLPLKEFLQTLTTMATLNDKSLGGHIYFKKLCFIVL